MEYSLHLFWVFNYIEYTKLFKERTDIKNYIFL